MYLAHHGILGQKWGVRRYQNTDGTLTEAGVKRYKPTYKEVKQARKDIKEGKSYNEYKSAKDAEKAAKNKYDKAQYDFWKNYNGPQLTKEGSDPSFDDPKVDKALNNLLKAERFTKEKLKTYQDTLKTANTKTGEDFVGSLLASTVGLGMTVGMMMLMANAGKKN